MESRTYLLIRALRLMPHSHAFDNHLTECVMADVFGDEGKTVTWRHVLRREPLPPWGNSLEGIALEMAHNIIH